MNQLNKDKLTFRRLVERNFKSHPIQQIARRSYLIAINSLVHEKLSCSLKIHGTNGFDQSRDNQQAAVLTRPNYNTFVPGANERPRSQAGSKMRRTTTDNNSGLIHLPSRNRFRSTGVFEVYQKLELGQRQLKIQQKRSQGQLRNPFCKIQKSRMAMLPSFALTESKVEEERIKQSARIPSVRPARQEKPQALSTREVESLTRQKSESVHYHEVKHYFQRKYG